MKSVGIIGAGPAGMMAALVATEQGATVTLFDTNREVGRKLAIAGGTRCNITHLGSVQELATHYHEAERFMLSALHRFDNTNLRDFFREKLNLPTIAESDGRVFPAVQSGKIVADRFQNALERGGVILKLGKSVQELTRSSTGLLLDGEAFSSVIICTGGASYSATGSTGWGFSLASQLGHDLSPLLPGLSGIRIDEPWPTKLSGVQLEQAKLSLLSPKNKRAQSSEGKLLFTHFGLSGPAALNLSRWVAKADSSTPAIEVDLLPHLHQDHLTTELTTATKANPQVQIKTIVKELLAEALAVIACSETGVAPSKLCADVNRGEVAALVRFLKQAHLTVRELGPLEAAQVTVGGISLRQIDPKTMASKVVPGLYFAGEVLDIDGQTGGYNLQAAFSTGYAAGTFAALREAHS